MLEWLTFRLQSSALWEVLLRFKIAVCRSQSSLDLIYVLDGSTSVQDDGFRTIINWVKEVSRTFIQQTNYSIQIGVIQFASSVRFDFTLLCITRFSVYSTIEKIIFKMLYSVWRFKQYHQVLGLGTHLFVKVP